MFSRYDIKSSSQVFADGKSLETGRFNFSASIMEEKDDQLKQPMNRV